MKLYHYDETSGVLLWTDDARVDELESQLKGVPVFVIPALATTIAPPSDVPENHIAYFDFEATPQIWKTVEIVAPEPEPELEAPEPITPVVPKISKRQFWQQIAMIGWIGRADALAFMATGVLPEAFETALETLDDDAQFAARMALMANEYERNNEFVPMLGVLFDKTDENIDALFIGAANT
jgi:hypothetical protein